MNPNHMSQVATADLPDLIDDNDDFETVQGPKALPMTSSNAPLSSSPTVITHLYVYNYNEMGFVTISPYAYHLWTDPTFSLMNPQCHYDITMTSSHSMTSL